VDNDAFAANSKEGGPQLILSDSEDSPGDKTQSSISIPKDSGGKTQTPDISVDLDSKTQTLAPVTTDLNNKTEIPIFFSIDNGYTLPTVVSLTSVVENANPGTFYKIYVIVPNNFSDENRFKIKEVQKLRPENCEINVIGIDNNLENLPKVPWYSNCAYQRLKIQEFFPNFDKGIYLDGDTVIKKDLGSLFNSDLGNCYLGAVPDGGLRVAPCEKGEALSLLKNLNIYQEYLGVSDLFGYVNSGVMVMNFKKMREDNVSSLFNKFIEEKGKFKEIPFVDQSVMNCTLAGNIKDLPLTYNVQTFIRLNLPYAQAIDSFAFSEEEWNNALISPTIIHYAGLKPWQNKRMVLLDEWWKQAKKTPIWEEIKERYLPEIGFENEEALFLAFDEIKEKHLVENKLENELDFLCAWRQKNNAYYLLSFMESNLTWDETKERYLTKIGPENKEALFCAWNQRNSIDPLNAESNSDPNKQEEILESKFEYAEKENEQRFTLNIKTTAQKPGADSGRIDSQVSTLKFFEPAQHEYKSPMEKASVVNTRDGKSLGNLLLWLSISGFSLAGAALYMIFRTLGFKIRMRRGSSGGSSGDSV
jgi:lipopolysaccharide biosynthesis glycosyltransferase